MNINIIKAPLLILVLLVIFVTRSSQAYAFCGAKVLDATMQWACPSGASTVCPGATSVCCSSNAECNTYSLATDCDPGAGGVPLGSCLKLSDDQQIQDVYNNPAFLVNLIVDNLFVVAGLIIFFMTLLAGFFFITGGKKGMEQAKQILLAVLIGFGLMFGAFWIVQIIQYITGADILL